MRRWLPHFAFCRGFDERCVTHTSQVTMTCVTARVTAKWTCDMPLRRAVAAFVPVKCPCELYRVWDSQWSVSASSCRQSRTRDDALRLTQQCYRIIKSTAVRAL